MRNLSDTELMLLVRHRHDEALSVLYDRHATLVYSFALKSLRDESAARDIVQTVFLRLWTTRSTHDPAAGSFKSWLITVTRNITIDWIRKHRRESELFRAMDYDELERLPDSSTVSPEEHAVNAGLKDQVRAAYHDLSKQQIMLLEHFYWRGYTLSELASIYDEPVGTIKNRLHQTLKKLRRHLMTEGDQR